MKSTFETLIFSMILVSGCTSSFSTQDLAQNGAGGLSSLQADSLWGVNGNATISANVFGSPLTITTTDRLAGAIGSLTYRGKEYINAFDHGRELQSAVSFDGLGECLNPTEAGSGPDAQGGTSTSQLLKMSAGDNTLSTAVQMAYWEAPGASYPNGCLFHPEIKNAQNNVPISNEILAKTVTIGALGFENVIEYKVNLWVPENHSSGLFEVLTPYLTGEFSAGWNFDPSNNGIENYVTGALPVIMGTPDQQHAMGIYVPGLTDRLNGYYGYAGFPSGDPANATYKSNAVIQATSMPAGNYGYTAYVIVGTLAEVRATMIQVAAQTKNPIKGNIDAVTVSGNQAVISGWACAAGMNQSINVDLYLNGPAGSGHMLSRTMANLQSESAVANACEAGGSAYRFLIPLSDADIINNAGQSIYVHGISTTGAANLTIGNSGVFTIPVPEVMGWIDGVDSGNGVVGWACATGLSTSIDVHLYIMGPAGQGGAFYKAVRADAASEPAVASACRAGGSAYRFRIQLDQDALNAYHGQPLFVHGISPAGRANSLIGNSGVFRVP